MTDLTTLTASLADMKTSLVNKLISLGDTDISTNDSMQTVVNHYDATRMTVLPTTSIDMQGIPYYDLSAYVAFKAYGYWPDAVHTYCAPRAKMLYGWSAYASSRQTVNGNFSNAEVLIIGSDGSNSSNNIQFTANTFSMPNLEYIFYTSYSNMSAMPRILPGTSSYSVNYPNIINMPKLIQIYSSYPNYLTSDTGITNTSYQIGKNMVFVSDNSQIEKIILPNLVDTGVNNIRFYNLSNLIYVNLSSWKGTFDSVNNKYVFNIDGCNLFYNCAALQCVQLGDTDAFGAYLGSSLTNLQTVCLHCTKVPTLGSWDMFVINDHFKVDGTGDGNLYVTDSLVDDFKSATNWTRFSAYIKPLSQFVNTWES